ncbi:MAG TPA: DUF481 domain-containing protein [Chitinophagaceae bacterium]|nr:DUF481 domain-containing protein [Chitinophagaceae bacterium]
MKGDKRKRITALVISIVLLNQGRAQFSDSVHHYLGYAATGIINQTNDGNSYVLNNNLKFNVNKKNKFLNTAAAWVYGKQNGVLTNNDFTSSMDFDIYGLSPRIYYWGLITYDKSFSLKINDRLQAGAGAGYNLSENKNASIVLSDGILYEYSDLKIDSAMNDRYSTLRNSLRLKYHFVFNGIIILDGVHFWQQSLSSGEDYILKSASSLSVKLKKWLNITSSLNYNKVNRTQRKNLLFTIGLSADYYF